MPDTLILYTAETLRQHTSVRAGETKLGQAITALPATNDETWEQTLQKNPAKFVLLGLPEDIGVRANSGRAGAAGAWNVALTAFLNLQNNSYIDADKILVLGHIDFSDLMDQAAGTKDLEILRMLTSQVDERVSPIIEGIVKAGKTPIVIGGGHNNAYPIIKGTASGLYKSGKTEKSSINCINCDAHTDLRTMEGRHSGNGFTYAMHESFLNRYYIAGPHQGYLTQTMLSEMKASKHIGFTTFEDFAVTGKTTFKEVLEAAAAHTSNTYCGLELDMDCIEHLPSSAQTTSGISANMARQFVSYTAAHTRPAYLHITEAAPSLGNPDQAFVTGKLIAALVADFIKAANVS